MRWLVVLAWLASFGVAAAADKVAYGPPAAWVKLADPDGPVGKHDDPPSPTFVSLLLMDGQHRLTAKGVTSYAGMRMRIDTADGLGIGGLAQEWDPATDSLTIHRLLIERDGRTIDVLKTQKFEILRRERSLEQSMLDGRLTASLQIADLRVGDIVDYAFSITREDPVFGGHTGLSASLAGGGRYGKVRVRMLWDKGSNVTWRAGDALARPRVGEAYGDTELLFEATDPKTPKAPEQAPPIYGLSGLIEVTQVKDWRELSILVEPLFTRAAALEPASPLKAEIERIRAAAATPEARAALALKLVQNDIRYLAVTMNAQGYVPAAADETWRRRFGDCKGKTALLMALLNGLGIDAEPVLAKASGSYILKAMLPRGDAFDHVLVRATIGGKEYWLDGTDTDVVSLKALETPSFGWVLPLRGAGADLIFIEPPQPERPTYQNTLRIDASKGLDRETPVVFETISRGSGGQAAARRYERMSKAEVQRTLISRFDRAFDWVTFSEAAWRFSPEDNELVLTLRGVGSPRIRSGDGVGRYELPMSLLSAPSLRLRPSHQDATAPYQFSRTRGYSRFLTQIILPGRGEGYVFNAVPQYFRLGGTRYTRWGYRRGGTVVLVRSTRFAESEISAEQMAREVAYSKRFRSTVAVLNWGGKPPPEALAGEQNNGIPAIAYSRELALIDTPEPVTALMRDVAARMDEGEFAAALKLMDQTKLDLSPLGDGLTITRFEILKKMNRGDAALAQLDARIARSPTAELLLYRADSFEERGDKAAMSRDLVRALDLAPQQPNVLRANVVRLESSKDFEAAATLQRRLVRVIPDDAEAWTRLARLENRTGHLAEADRALRDAAETGIVETQIFMLKGQMLIDSKKLEAGVAEYDKAVASAPGDAYPLNSACWARATANIELPKALAQCEQAVKLEPKAAAYRDSLAFVKLRQGRPQEAIIDYDAALKLAPDLSASLYGRGVAKLRVGREQAGQADLAAARKVTAAIDEEFAGYGVTP